MDVNVNTEVKMQGAPVAPVVEQEDRVKPQVAPVPKDEKSAKVSLSDESLHGKKGRGKESGTLSREELDKVIEEIQGRLDAIGGNLSVGLKEDMETESIVVQVRDKVDRELIRQFPSEEVLKLRAKLNDLVGLLFEGSA